MNCTLCAGGVTKNKKISKSQLSHDNFNFHKYFIKVKLLYISRHIDTTKKSTWICYFGKQTGSIKERNTEQYRTVYVGVSLESCKLFEK